MNEFVVAESAIRQLHARYVDAGWRKDVAAFLDCFAADGEWKIAGQHCRGHAQIADQFEKLVAPYERIVMLLGMPVLEVGQGTAVGRVPVTEILKLTSGDAFRTIGIYYDRFVAQEAGWRYQSRHFDLYYYGPPDFSAPFYDCRDYGPPPGMPEADDPTTVRQSS